MKTKISAFAVILGCCLSVIATSSFAFDFGSLGKVIQAGKKLTDATTEIDEPQEIAIGQGMASNLLGAAPLLQNKKVQQYVNSVGLWLTMQTGRPDLPWNFAVLDDDDINAFAAPGGYIFITNGLLKRMNNEAELAGVLAHEISHVLQKHHLRAIKKSAGISLVGDLLGEAAQKRGGMAGPVVTKIANLGTELYTRGLDKGDEFEADRMGIVIAARAGYHPYGLPAVLQSLQSVSSEDAGIALMFKTHPKLSDRLSLLDTIMSPSFDRFEGQPDLAQRFKTAMGTAGKK